MAKESRNFIKGKMNKELDERLVPNGEYIDAQNIRVGSTEEDDMGVVETAKGNLPLTAIQYQSTVLSNQALCIGAFEDGSEETLYWFVHDPAFTASANTNKLDLIVSFNTNTNILTYHVVSMDDGGGVNTTLNFDPQYLITGVDKVDNLLFFTDDTNPPRKINVTRSYAEPTALDVDQVTAEELLVIRKPPSESPTVTTNKNSNINSEFLDERYICFAYRWRYDDNEYSATSQFSIPAFQPKGFNFTPESYLNEGMVNEHNVARVTFNTGGSLVKGIDLLFKEADNSVIKVIEKLDKAELGYGDNNNITFDFTNSKIFTLLPESEILRLYDNVPKLAKAQTLMGNRLMYGNYEEGYNLVDKDGNPTQLSYVCEKVSVISEQSAFSGTVSKSSVIYSLPAAAGGVNATVPDAKVTFSNLGNTLLTNADGTSKLKAGCSLELVFNLSYDASGSTQIIGATPAPSQTLTSLEVVATFTVSANYDSFADWIASESFLNSVGTITNIKPVYSATDPTSCDGGTLTDVYNCSVDQELGIFKIYSSGITSATTVLAPEPLSFSDNGTGTDLEVQFTGLWYVDDVAAPTTNYFLFYKIDDVACTFFNNDSARSLHSNRGYEVGMVYMDEYGRSTTALVSPDNAIHFPCDDSNKKNSIKVTIPTLQLAPSWAHRYKFVIKPDEEAYNTIYSNLFYVDATRNRAYIYLQGENSLKVEDGDRLIVKRDTSGPKDSCTYITVLEKKVFSEQELIAIGFTNDPPSGPYMVIDSSGLELSPSANSTITVPQLNAEATNFWNGFGGGDSDFPFIWLPLNSTTYWSGNCFGTDYTVPAGSIITLKVRANRTGAGSGNTECHQRTYEFDLDFTATQSYDNMKDWFIGDGVAAILNNPTFFSGGGTEDTMTYAGTFGSTQACSSTTYPVGFTLDNATQGELGSRGVPNVAVGEFKSSIITYTTAGGRTFLTLCGTRACGSNDNRKSTLTASMVVRRAVDLIVFETLPQDANPDLFYESAESYSIDTATGRHNGNVQNQTASLPAIVDTDFFNCFSFGNGVESYRIRDSITGKVFGLGNRATTTLGQDYKQVRRYADITYSEVYNQESNVNKLNEFNLGLLNFKPLEQSFGAIQILHARETDVLTLQEDKISYVLADKNLLSDAVGGGSVTSVPEVLGTQIARTEEYGISFNPESFVSYGYDKFFTDAKRGSVIRLSGTGQSESLTVISDASMGTWFRDLFQVAFEYQKLGAYDPYMDEYVLSSTTRKLPAVTSSIPCGVTQTFTLEAGGSTESFIADVGSISENFVVSFVLIGTGSVNINAVYDGVSYGSPPYSASGSFTVPKPNSKPTQATINLTPITGSFSVQITVECPVGEVLNIYQVCLTSLSDGKSLIHNEFRFSQGSYTSPTESVQVEFSGSTINPIVSQFDLYTGFQGQGYFPSDGSAVTVISNKFGDDTYVFDVDDSLMYLRTNVSYVNSQAGITGLLAEVVSSADGGTISPLSGSSPYVSGNFTMPSGSNPNLYLIYDYRTRSTAAKLRKGVRPDIACCAAPSTGPYYLDGADLSSCTMIYSDALLNTTEVNGWWSDGVVVRELTGSGTTDAQLSAVQTCPLCPPDCGTTLSMTDSLIYGLFSSTVELGSATGAVIIVVTNGPRPLGLQGTYSGVNYNLLTSTNGKLQSSVPANNYTVVGASSDQCTGLVSTSDYLNYEANQSTWIQGSGSTSVTIGVGDLALTTAAPTTCVMVIPKLTASPSTLLFKILAACKTGNQFDLEVKCPVALTPYTTSILNLVDCASACATPTGGTHYFVRPDGTQGPALHAFVFTDANGSTLAGSGYIAYVGNCYTVTDGVVTIVASC